MSLPDDVVPSPQTPAPALVQKLVTLTEIEYIGLVQQAHYWHSAHQHAVQREQLLRTELEQAHARIRQLEHLLFAYKSEQHTPHDKQAQSETTSPAKGQRRGQRWGTKGHGRHREQELSARHEWIGIEPAQCPCCGLPLRPFPGTEEAEVIEIDVKAYRRVIHRKRYQPSCQCGVLAGIVTAPAPHRLVDKGKFGISVWVLVLLDKFVYGRPSQRLLQQLADSGMHMAAGSLAQGLQEIEPLLRPLALAIQQRVHGEQHWHADETRWAVFTEIQGKVGYRWYLWVFHSATAVHYVLDPSRAEEVVEHELGDVNAGILSCDRYSGYKKFARLHEGVLLAYCWAHQRRDFLDLANAYPQCETWAFDWVQAIAQLYHLNACRLQAALDTPEREQAQIALQEAVEKMAQRRDVQLISPALHQEAVKVLRSMKEHWSGLTVFVQAPWVEMDNNIAERDMRIAVVGRKNFYGSGAPWSAQLAATMFSLAATLRLWKINPRTWLTTYLTACAASGNQVPESLDAVLPWTMDAEQLAMMRKAYPAGFDTS